MSTVRVARLIPKVIVHIDGNKMDNNLGIFSLAIILVLTLMTHPSLNTIGAIKWSESQMTCFWFLYLYPKFLLPKGQKHAVQHAQAKNKKGNTCNLKIDYAKQKYSSISRLH